MAILPELKPVPPKPSVLLDVSVATLKKFVEHKMPLLHFMANVDHRLFPYTQRPYENLNSASFSLDVKGHGHNEIHERIAENLKSNDTYDNTYVLIPSYIADKLKPIYGIEGAFIAKLYRLHVRKRSDENGRVERGLTFYIEALVEMPEIDVIFERLQLDSDS